MGFRLDGVDVKSTPMMRKIVLLSLVCGACASEGPLTKAGVAPDEAARDHQQCESQMYVERQSKGRSPPNWNLYEYCMRQRGYARAH